MDAVVPKRNGSEALRANSLRGHHEFYMDNEHITSVDSRKRHWPAWYTTRRYKEISMYTLEMERKFPFGHHESPGMVGHSEKDHTCSLEEHRLEPIKISRISYKNRPQPTNDPKNKKHGSNSYVGYRIGIEIVGI